MTIQYSANGQLQHLLALETLQTDTIFELFALADEMQKGLHNKTLNEHYLCNVFFEASTRTVCSFELAAKRLGVNVVNFVSYTSSTKKGETLLDTVQTLNAMNFDAFVIRHTDEGSAEHIANVIGKNTAIINAGDGCNEHPTQALLDAYTISQHNKTFDQLSIGIVGDIAHSRVARSLMFIFKHLGVPDCRIIGARELLPDSNLYPWVREENNLERGLKDLDVVITLRMQKERMDQNNVPDRHEYFKYYGLTEKRLALMKKNAIVMHPGPINRDVEIASSVADGSQSVILDQVRNGVLMRMAVIYQLMQQAS